MNHVYLKFFLSKFSFDELFFVFWQTRVHPLLPYGIMGVGAFVAALLCITLPETKDQPTAEVVGDTGSDVIIEERKSDEAEEENTEFTSKL